MLVIKLVGVNLNSGGRDAVKPQAWHKVGFNDILAAGFQLLNDDG
jgi:hypothetical protein